MLAQGAGVGVGLGAAHGFAVVGLGRRVDLRVFLAVAAVGEAPLTKLTLEWLLPCNTNTVFTQFRYSRFNTAGYTQKQNVGKCWKLHFTFVKLTRTSGYFSVFQV